MFDQKIKIETDDSDRNYQMAVNAHREFFSKDPVNLKVQCIIDDFEKQYYHLSEMNPFRCDVTGIPAVSRILLIKKMTELNLNRRVKDILVEFRLDHVLLRASLCPEWDQRGNLVVHDIDSYDKIQQKMSFICSFIQTSVIVKAMRTARLTGTAITRNYCFNKRVDVEFLNRFMFLWDCEIARHLQRPFSEDEIYLHVLPISVGISSVHFLIEKCGVDFDCYLNKFSPCHFFSADAVEKQTALKNVLRKRNFYTLNELRQELAKEFGVERF